MSSFHLFLIRKELFRYIIHSTTHQGTKHRPSHHKTSQSQSQEEHNQEFRRKFAFD